MSTAADGPSTWSTARVVQWLKECGLQVVVPNFEAALVDGDMLQEITKDILDDIGVAKALHFRILRDIKRLFGM